MDHVPPPSELVKGLSPEGEEHLDAMLAMSITPEELFKKLFLLSPNDSAILWKIHRHRSLGDRHENERLEEDFAQHKPAGLVFRRARELEPSVIDGKTTLEGAIRVLERHGEKPPTGLDEKHVIELLPVEEEAEG